MTYFDPSSGQYFEVPEASAYDAYIREFSPPRRIHVPFLNRETGLGDAIASATSALGVQPCTPCEERKRKLNQRFVLSPWGT